MEQAPNSSTSLLARTRGHAGAWYWASRPFSLTASVVPILAGSALAFQEGRASLPLFLLALLASALVQVGTNLVDEYSDDSTRAGQQKLLAPYKVIALGRLSRRAVRRGAVLSFAAATGIGLYIVSVTGWPILAVALASLAVAYLYAGGPRPLGTLALGNPLVFLFMGPVMVMGVYYVHTQAVTWTAFWVSMPVACLVTAILVANDLRDIAEDQYAGKRTLVTLLGRRFGQGWFTALVAAAFLAAALLATTGGLGLTIFLTAPALLPAAESLRRVWGEDARPSLAVGMRQAARLHWWFGLLFAAGLALGRWVE